MHVIFTLLGRPLTLLALITTIMGFASAPISATIDVTAANTQFITQDELRQVIELVLFRGRTADVLGEPNTVNYMEARQGGLRQYITVEAMVDPDGGYNASRVHFTQEFWSKTPADDDVINQWIISIESNSSQVVHRQLTENDGRVIDISKLPAGSGDTRNVVRSIISTFLDR